LYVLLFEDAQTDDVADEVPFSPNLIPALIVSSFADVPPPRQQMIVRIRPTLAHLNLLAILKKSCSSHEDAEVQKSDAAMRIAVIVPAFNEEQILGITINSIPRSIAMGNEVNIIVIDDGSSDRTSDVAHANGADIIVQHKSNLGLARAFKSGLQAAIAIDAEIMVVFDADCQFSSSEISKVVLPIVDGTADVVIGSRFEDLATAKSVPISKRLGNQLVSLIVSLVTGKLFTDTQCGFRAISRRAAMELNVWGFFTYTQEMIIILYAKQFKIVQVPVSVKYYGNRESRIVKRLPLYALKAFALILIALLRVHRFRIAMVVLALFSFIASYGIGFSLFTQLYSIIPIG
jgi:glycosyltransferase involved in cell wall biosynthesis